MKKDIKSSSFIDKEVNLNIQESKSQIIRDLIHVETIEEIFESLKGDLVDDSTIQDFETESSEENYTAYMNQANEELEKYIDKHEDISGEIEVDESYFLEGYAGNDIELMRNILDNID